MTGLPGCESARYKVIKTYSNGVATSTVMNGVQIDGVNITLDKSNAAVKAALKSSNEPNVASIAAATVTK